MTNRIDEIFAVEKLRQNWEAGAKAKALGGRVAAFSDFQPGPIEVYEKLGELIEQRFPGNLNPGMELLLGQLLECLLMRFPPGGATNGCREKAASDRVILKTMDRIEDLFEAMEFGDEASK